MTTPYTRIAIALLQGGALYTLFLAATHQVWPAGHPLLFSPLFLISALLPILAQAGLNLPSKGRLLGWLAALAAVLAVIGAHDHWRVGAPLVQMPQDNLPAPLSILGASLFLLIAWPLIQAKESERRWLAPYAVYFDGAWKFALQLLFSSLFVGVFWLVLLVGAWLFYLVKIDYLFQLFTQPWFALPASSLALAAGLHLTDVRPGIIRGIRSLALTLLSCLLPLLTLLIGAFLAQLPFTGLQNLWKTGYAATLLLSSAGLLIFLLNSAYQDGAGERPKRVQLISMRLACLLLSPLSGLAAYALALRIVQHGWTPGRVLAVAGSLICICYALGYGWAALRRSQRLEGLAFVNIATAWLTLFLLAALLSPLADPVQISVASQMARLQAGRVAPDRFDFDFLRSQGMRYGHEALLKLQSDANPIIRRKAGDALGLPRPSAPARPLAQSIRAKGETALPASFLAQNWSIQAEHNADYPACLRDGSENCIAFSGTFSGSGKQEVLLVEEASSNITLYRQDKPGQWTLAARYSPPPNCQLPADGIQADRIRALPPTLPDLEISGLRLRPDYPYEPQSCPSPPKTAP
ncbi:DUF4153 domain-containing protein [Chromobacterium sp. IIBBL 290-4]|uniref:DUF4153 domain-containing protein n=1 Tax=Chromobacterium sp. IIBBL 290-4 TaxID=2953890 RepID=UPI0020B6649F|nr:DUF4153 domain-containing protein [Chromobacterium sp. IIBBL 290-4]UTH74926.1 DUF4153 domain-containing protein [Chromobacterium sp. IIBBL 290-4]